MKGIIFYFFLLSTNVFSQYYKLSSTFQHNYRNNLQKSYSTSYSNIKVEYMNIDSTVINPSQLDTNYYSVHYNLMGIYDFYNPGFDGKLTLGDFNGDGNTEIYCTQWVPQIFYSPAKIYEFDTSHNPELVYTYPDSQTVVLTSYDINSDGKNDLILNSSGSRGIHIYNQNNINSYPTHLLFDFSFGPDYQVDLNTFCDVDKDGNTDYLFYAPTGKDWFFIYEYDSLQNNFIKKYSGDEDFYSGFLVCDFNLDGNNEIIGGHIDGKVIMLECLGNDQYGDYKEFNTELYNTYQNFYTDDIDNDGLPEFWIGGTDFSNNSFKYICFELVDNQTVKRITSISILNSDAYPYGYVTARDFDNDGTQEIFIALNERMYILKFVGSPNHPQYEVKYYGIIKSQNHLNFVDNITLYDIFNRGETEILVSLLEGDQTNFFERTYIYTPHLPTNVKTNHLLNPAFHLFQNYPNPFNPVTTIQYSLSQFSIVSLKVYNILGAEISTLVNEGKSAGSYSVNFDGSALPGGVYIYRLTAGNYSSAKKLILLK